MTFMFRIVNAFFLRRRIAAACWSFHYAKRLLETIFVHRFSNATMPILNLFKNCGYYWGFAAYVGYHVNHPLYTSPGTTQIYAGLAAFLVCLLQLTLFKSFLMSSTLISSASLATLASTWPLETCDPQAPRRGGFPIRPPTPLLSSSVSSLVPTTPTKLALGSPSPS